MKKILFTTLFWLIVLFWFVFYIKFLDSEMATAVSNFIIRNPDIVASNKLRREFDEKFDTLITSFDDLDATVREYLSESNTWEALEVALYYFNKQQDENVPTSQQPSIDSILPVYRQLVDSDNIIKDTINLLIKWELTQEELEQWFETEFPNPEFRLLSAQLEDWVLTLTFTQVPWFTSWWSARIKMLTESIIRTAKQFSGVQEVVLMPEEIFQP